MIKSLLLETNFLGEELKEKYHIKRILLSMRWSPIKDCGTTSCSNHPLVKSSECSCNNNNNMNNNISSNNINDNISNDIISNNNINNNNTSNNNISNNNIY